jgi:ABC-type nitrate/sulfonate/bicarbonate transport system ATPase subunit
MEAGAPLKSEVYSKKHFVVLDDVFSALDRSTESRIIEQLLGLHGIFRRNKITVVLTTHTGKENPMGNNGMG